jgi:hypothetical protein
VAPGTIGRVDVRRRELTAGEVANQFATGTGGTTQGGAASGKR